jgi:hypothetical protein
MVANLGQVCTQECISIKCHGKASCGAYLIFEYYEARMGCISPRWRYVLACIPTYQRNTLSAWCVIVHF